MKKARKKLWIDDSGTRYFLIPTTWQFPVGDLLIHSMNGYSWRIDADDLKAFEITEDAAHAHLQRKVNRTFETLLNEFKSQGALLPDALPNDSPFDASQLGEMFGVFADLLDGTTDAQSPSRETARGYLHDIEERLREQGQSFDFDLSSLVDEVPHLYSRQQKSDITTLSRELRSLAEMLSQPTSSLETVIQAWERMTLGPLRLDVQREKQDAERRQTIRASADQAIARSLQAFGFKTDDGA